MSIFIHLYKQCLPHMFTKYSNEQDRFGDAFPGTVFHMNHVFMTCSTFVMLISHLFHFQRLGECGTENK